MNTQQFKPQCTTQAELFREAARVSEMCEGTGISIFDCVKFNGRTRDYLNFDDAPQFYEFMLEIVEGKPVFRGDELYVCGKGEVIITGRTDQHLQYSSGLTFGIVLPSACSWLPPKPKTLTIELPFDVVQRRACGNIFCSDAGQIIDAFQKALAKQEGAE